MHGAGQLSMKEVNHPKHIKNLEVDMIETRRCSEVEKVKAFS